LPDKTSWKEIFYMTQNKRKALYHLGESFIKFTTSLIYIKVLIKELSSLMLQL